MPHNITERDGFFTVRQPAWHGLGAVLNDYPDRATAQAIAHPWEPEEEPVYVRRVGPERFGDPRVEYQSVRGFKAIRRSDDHAVIGLVGSSYTPVRNDTLWDIAEALEGLEPEAVRYETAGSLKGGAKVWVLLRLREPVQVPGDPHGAVIPYFALQNYHDATGSFSGKAVLVRLVCDNTWHAADLDARARGTEFTFRHTRNVADRIEQARVALTGWRTSVRTHAEVSRELLDLKVDDEAVTGFVESFIPMPPTAISTERMRANTDRARQRLRRVLASPTCEGIEHTAYGLVQAGIEFAQHERRSHGPENRFRRAYLDSSRITRDAVRLAREAAV